ncbi:MAG: primosomal protein N' [Nitrospirae bacterium]|nr:primosomal protein N' [Nitrospirota bacterium]MDA1305580.1 primosomal protein N' [Nitrospirota bacterium]
MPPTFAEVIFPQRLTQSFTYRIPTSWHDALKVGHWVGAPFGRTARPGFVVSLSETPADPTVPIDKIRELEEHLTSGAAFDLDPTLRTLAEWMADYYIAPLGVCFQLIQPPRLPFKTASRLRITPLGQQAIERGRLSEHAKTLLNMLDQKPKGLTLPTLKKAVATASTTVTQLKRQKWVEEIHTYTVPSTTEAPTGKAKGELSILNRQETEPMSLPMWWKDFQRHLTEQSFGEYFSNDGGLSFSSLLACSIREALDRKRTALIIFPDIHQAVGCAQTLSEDLGVEVGIFHSGLTDTVRMKEWQAIRHGRYQVVVGTRMSVFAPMPSLGFICLSHEEDSTFKDEKTPYYHARDVARKRAQLSHTTFLLHSPHPTLETFQHFSSSTKSNEAASIPHCKDDLPQVIDHLQIPYGTTISDEMRDGIEQSLSTGGGIVIFHNRKGFSSSLACRDCGLAAQCDQCQVPFGLLTVPPKMRCPYCGKVESIPVTCPACAGSHLEPGGFGTERLEQELRREFPGGTIGRYDRNNIRTEAEARNIREQFTKGTIHILIGTEMLFHGPRLTPVRLVGIPYADAGLHRPDFRSAERLYHHLQSAIQLVTEHEWPNPVVLQTRLPSHHVMQAVAQQQPSLFYEHELAFREAVGYPPFLHFIQMTVSGSQQLIVQEGARQWVQALASQLASHSSKQALGLAAEMMILGPLASHALTHRRLFRENILFKAADFDQARTVIRRTHATMTANKLHKGLQFGINVDPMDMG